MTPGGILKKLFEIAVDGHRWLLTARATDMTVACAGRRSIVFAPHPDDETLGCGATIMRKRDAGTDVFVVIAADGGSSHRSALITPAQLSAIRRGEALDACESMGVPPDHVMLLGYPDQHLSANGPALSLKVGELILQTDPQEIYAPSQIDSHPDHRALSAAVRAAACRIGFQGAVYEYPIWMQAPGAWFDTNASLPVKTLQAFVRPLLALFRLRPAIVRSHGFAGRKRAAMDRHRSQTSNITGEETWAVLDDQFLRKFTERDEIFFKITKL